jgi:phosphate-selective porin OprO and OprP
MIKQTFFIAFVLFSINSIGQTTNDVLSLLTKKNLISEFEADSIRAEAALKQQEVDAKKKIFPIMAGKNLQLSGYMQMRYQNLDEAGKMDGFDIRRARFDVRGNISPIWNYRVQLDLAVSPKLLDAYAECKLADFFNLTVGQFKVPFSLENLTSSNKLEMIDRSQIVEAMSARGTDVIGNQNGRDIGIMAGGSLLKLDERFLVDYRLGVFNGSGINVADKNEAKDVAARIVVHPIKGLDLGGSYYNGWDNFGKTTAFNQVRSRWGADMSYEYELFALKSEYIKGKDGIVNREGWYVQPGIYILPQKLQLLLRYDTFNSDIAADDATLSNYSAVVNYNFTSTTRLQAGYTIRKEQGKQINNNIGVIQFQIGF